MDVYALIGPSGTGKSHHAMEVAEKHQIAYIIDDGLLIRGGKRIAGRSAKAEPTMVAAVKCAVFLDPQHAEEVRKALEENRVHSLLILGTSEHMIDRIVGALGLPPLKETIYIHDVVTPQEMAIAKKMRSEGKHVIPLPAVEVKKTLPNLWIDPVVNFFRRKTKEGEAASSHEKSIIRPRYSELGRIVISSNVFIGLVNHLAMANDAFDHTPKTTVRMTDMGVIITCENRVRYGTVIQQAVCAFQKQVVEEVERVTGLGVRSVNVHIIGVF